MTVLGLIVPESPVSFRAIARKAATRLGFVRPIGLVLVGCHCGRCTGAKGQSNKRRRDEFTHNDLLRVSSEMEGYFHLDAPYVGSPDEPDLIENSPGLLQFACYVGHNRARRLHMPLTRHQSVEPLQASLIRHVGPSAPPIMALQKAEPHNTRHQTGYPGRLPYGGQHNKISQHEVGPPPGADLMRRLKGEPPLLVGNSRRTASARRPRSAQAKETRNNNRSVSFQLRPCTVASVTGKSIRLLLRLS